MSIWKLALFGLVICCSAQEVKGQAESLSEEQVKPLEQGNLVAWCIVPFDAKKRSPNERAEMLVELGIQRCAYDWREEHVPTFEAEILAYKQHGIEFFAFWGAREEAFELFEKYDLHPQIWQMIPAAEGETQQQQVESAAKQLVPLAERTKALDCSLALYNHGGWGGRPENMVAVCERLNGLGYDHVGIVYNFHHAHDAIDQWRQLFPMMKPHLLCLNLNGMNDQAQPKILGIGQGEHELKMIRYALEQGYRGPIGVLDHRQELDSRRSLNENLKGLEWLKRKLVDPEKAGAPPKAEDFDVDSEDELDESGNFVIAGNDSYRKPPLTFECITTQHRSDTFNILIASDSKASADHWEVFTMNGNGHLTAYLPGYSPDHVRCSESIVDGKSHHIAAIYETDRFRFYLDGRKVADQAIAKKRSDSLPGGLGIGRLVEGGLASTGSMRKVWLRKGALPPTDELELQDLSGEELKNHEATLYYWQANDSTAAQPMGDNVHSMHGHPHHDPSVTKQTKAEPFPSEYDSTFVKSLVEQAQHVGDARQGARVFTQANLACLSCHQVGEFGGQVGPNLTRIATTLSPEKIVESLFWPQRAVAKEFESVQVLTLDGKVLSGYQRQIDEDQLTLFDIAEQKEVLVAQDDIEEIVAGGSPMPSDLMNLLDQQQRLDLISFLSSLANEDGTLDRSLEMELVQSQQHGPVEFVYDRAPIDPQRWSHRGHEVNKHRLYDFYAKQANYFRKWQQDRPLPMLIEAFPGLDGGEFGHWGTQEEADWADDRWNEADLGSLQSGVLRFDGQVVSRAICIRVGDEQNWSVCFDMDSLTIPAVWKDGFVKFSPVRHGFIDGMQFDGKRVVVDQPKPLERDAQYLGYYRDGARVVFAYRVGETTMLDFPWVENGKFTREIAPVDQHSMAHVVRGGQAQWPEEIEAPIRYGNEAPYAIDTIELPWDNPWNAMIFCGGHDFLPDGSALVCTMQGDVWHATGFALKSNAESDRSSKKPSRVTWRRFASGLHHALGMVVCEEGIFVQCRDQLVRLHDLNRDGEADFYECFSKAFETSPAGHDYICGLQRDKQGRFYTASGNQGLIRISSDGATVEVLATGFRNPDGLGLHPDGFVTVPCSEGEWTPASMICLVPDQNSHSQSLHVPTDVNRPLHFGYRGPIDEQPPAVPLVYLPRGMDNSSGGQVYVDSQQWGPLAEKMIHLSFGMGTHFLLLTDEVDEMKQGAVVPLPGDFLSGVHRGRFHPVDGQLYVSGMDGWVSFTPVDGCFQRVRYTGGDVQLPVDFHVHENGIRVTFSQPLREGLVTQSDSHFAQAWNYQYGEGYGSPELSPSHPGTRGHDPLRIESVTLLEDGHSLFFEIPELQPVSQLHLSMRLGSETEQLESGSSLDNSIQLLATINRLDRPFTEIANYRARPKVVGAHPLLRDMAMLGKRIPNPWQEPLADARQLTLKTGKNLSYETRELRVEAGENVKFTLINPDVVPHNWVLTRPGKLRAVGELANRLIGEPDAVVRHYVPESEDVLAWTDVVAPKTEFSIYFRAPETPGRYPFVCTFPGHWMVMNGELIVE